MIHGLDLDDHTRPPLARLNSSGLPIFAKQANKVWRGLVQVEGSMEPAIPVALKWIGGETKLATELGCSLAASVLGLPVPKGLLVLAGRDQLPGLSAAAKPTLGGNDVLCFASVYQWPDDTWARLSDDESASEYSFSHLCETSQAAPGAAWDELAANADRHARNIVFDGLRYWLIDHDLALQPLAPLMKRFVGQLLSQRLVEHQARANILATELATRHPANHRILEQPSKFERSERRIRLLADNVREWHTGNVRVDPIWPLTELVLRGIALRLPPLQLLLQRRLNIRDPESLWNSSTSSPNQ